MELLNRLRAMFIGFDLSQQLPLSLMTDLETTDIIYRKAEHEDVQFLLAVERDVYAGEVPWTFTHFTREIDNNPEAVFIIAEKQSQIIGFIGLRVWLRKREIHVTNFAVVSGAQRQGVGQTLMKQAQALANNLKCRKISLETPCDSLGAQGFYRKQGFESARILISYYEDGKDALCMEKAL